MKHVSRERTKHVLRACFNERERTTRIARFPTTMKTQAFRTHQTAELQQYPVSGAVTSKEIPSRPFLNDERLWKITLIADAMVRARQQKTVVLDQREQAQTNRRASLDPNVGYHYRIHHALLRPGASSKMDSKSRMDPMEPGDRKPFHQESGSPKKVITWPLVLR